MSELIKRSCIALLAGTALSMNMDVEGAKADMLDDRVNECFQVSQSRQLNYQEAEYCNRILQLKQERDYKINMNKLQFDIYQWQLRTMQDIYGIGANPVIIKPTDFGTGNYNP